jgi:hypothetical protein
VTVDNSAPTVSVTAPAAGAIVSGSSVSVKATAADNVAVAGVQFKLDGANLGAEDTSTPYSITWNTTSASEGTHTISAVARDAAGNTTQASAVSVKVDNVAPPAPAQVRDGPGADQQYTIVATQLRANWDAVVDAGSGINHYELAIGTTSGGKQTLAYTNVGTVTSYTAGGLSLSNNTTYYVSVRAVDNAGRTGAVRTANGITVDTALPTVAMSAPANNATVSGTAVTVTATASDTHGIASVQFMLDGVNLGSPDTTSPYSIVWNTTTAANGTHTLQAKAVDVPGNVQTSTSRTVTVQN